jgi:hypothetical protein
LHRYVEGDRGWSGERIAEMKEEVEKRREE